MIDDDDAIVVARLTVANPWILFYSILLARAVNIQSPEAAPLFFGGQPEL